MFSDEDEREFDDGEVELEEEDTLEELDVDERGHVRPRRKRKDDEEEVEEEVEEY